MDSRSPMTRERPMNLNRAVDRLNLDRRTFCGTVVGALSATGLGMLSASATAAPNGWRLKQIDAGLLRVSYAEVGPASGPPVILLHGWPYDIHSFSEVAPILAANGFRVIAPYLRGYGPTRFLSPGTMRNGQPVALATDAAAL